MKRVNKIMLIDDNKLDNLYNKRVIMKNEVAGDIIVKDSAQDALNYLVTNTDNAEELPNLIFLDINMPEMDGWGFIEEYKKMNKNLSKNIVIVMLSSSVNPDDKSRAMTYDVLCDYKSKPLTTEMLLEVVNDCLPS